MNRVWHEITGSVAPCAVELPACTCTDSKCADSKCLPSKSCRKKISPVLMTEEFSEVLKIITFLQMIHGSLKEGWFKQKRAFVHYISLHLGVYLNLYTWECIVYIYVGPSSNMHACMDIYCLVYMYRYINCRYA